MSTSGTHAPKFYTKSGALTPYGFACGYVEKFTISGASIHLWEEHGMFHVRAYCNGARLFWQAYDTLTEARKRFRQGKKEATVAAVAARLDH